MNAISSWSSSAPYYFTDADKSVHYHKKINNNSFDVHLVNSSLWIVASLNNKCKVAFRTAFCPDEPLKITQTTEIDNGIELSLLCSMADFKVIIHFTESDYPILHYTTSIIPHKPLLFPFSPRDILILDKNGQADNIIGEVKTNQVGTRSGIVYFNITKPKAGALMYCQNLTALADYCNQTHTSGADTVGGQWPELGFALPPTKEKPLKAGQEIIISDAFVAFDNQTSNDEPAMVHQYLNMLAALYLELPKPKTVYQNWPEILQKGLKDLMETPGCWLKYKGDAYLNAYLSDYKTPPEIMVQLAVLLPLIDYIEWKGEGLKEIQIIKKNLPNFYNKKIGSIMRWLPDLEDQLEGEEEQKKPKVMDSWYLHHPLLNLSRLALKGDKEAEKLFLDSLEFAIKVAHHFKYTWPVFYKMDTVEVVKAEKEERKGGEKDVAGIYAHVMLQAWELTGKKRYLNEAEKAAQTLQGMGFELFYQANNTAFSAGALLRLWKVTQNKIYLELSYLCLANIFKNVQLWECQYGYSHHFPTFFALFPLQDAPYTAVYEEAEVFCAFHDYLNHADNVEIMPAAKLLITEYIRYLVHRAAYYYPPMLPKEMLAEKPKIGELDPHLWIALEDIQDGWEQSGTVGQEVYGAGNAFGILPRHYIRIPDEDYMIFTEYPVHYFSYEKGKSIEFKLKGDGRLNCLMMLIAGKKKTLPDCSFFDKNENQQLKSTLTKDGHRACVVKGNATISIVLET